MDVKAFAEQYNLTLNFQQLEAVGTTEGGCLLLAVPGSGKTTVLVIRLGYMIYECGINPENILTLTYTKAATIDMAERFKTIFKGQYSEELKFSTINSLSNAILYKFSVDNGKEVFDLEQDDGKRAKRISKIYRDIMNEYPTEGDIKDVSSSITYIKNMMLDDKELLKMDKKVGYQISKIYLAYKQSMRADKVIDYDDQMVYAHMILSNYPDVLAYYQNKYKYICVDEAQDTSKIQHMIINLLAGKNGNLFMVGDEDQSIYGFRAAYPEALLEFEKIHQGAKVLLMEENFRSNSSIVEAADIFIQKNTLRHNKRIMAHREKGVEIKRIHITDRTEQYDHIIKAVKESDKEIAVLYRYNECVIPLVDMFDRNNIPFRIKGDDLSFFTHRVVQDITDIFNLILNENDSERFLKIYYKLNIYITKNEAIKIVNASRNGSIFDTILKINFGDEQKNKRLKAFAKRMKRFKTGKTENVFNTIENTMGYKSYLQKNNVGIGELSILKYIFRYTETIESALKRLDALRNIIINNKSNVKCKTIFSTIHNSKGLEYDTVYILDAIDGVFPVKPCERLLFSNNEELAEYEEERRIFYVGITRAKDELILFKHKNGSTFIDEMKPIVRKVEDNSIFNVGRVSIK